MLKGLTWPDPNCALQSFPICELFFFKNKMDFFSIYSFMALEMKKLKVQSVHEGSLMKAIVMCWRLVGKGTSWNAQLFVQFITSVVWV